MPNAKRSDAEREASLAYAREHSAAEAADTFGVPLGTIRRWQWEEREKAKKAEAQAQMSDDGRVRALLTIASMERVTEKGIARLEEIMDTAKSPQSLATMCGILDDKRRLRVLEQQQAEIHDKEIEERTVRIEGQRAQDFIMVLRMAHETVGVPGGATGEIMAIVAKLFRQLGVEDVLSISPADAEKAQKAFRTWIEEDIARALRVQVADEISRAEEARLAAQKLLEAGPEEDEEDEEVVEEVDLLKPQPLPPGAWVGADGYVHTRREKSTPFVDPNGAGRQRMPWESDFS
jgi:transposase